MSENNKSKMGLILNVVLLIAVAALFVMQFSSNQKVGAGIDEVEISDSNLVEGDGIMSAEISQSNASSNFTIAYVDTDSLMLQYQFYIDANKKVENYEIQLRNRFESTANKFYTDYETYVAQVKAGSITPQQGKETEARLEAQQEELKGMEQKLAKESVIYRQEVSQQVADTVKHFLDRYREQYGYTLILQYGSMSSLLSADSQHDITADVIGRLNAKYEFDQKF